MAANSRMAELRKKFQGNQEAFVPTPENQFGRIKKSKDEQAKAIRIAKARAARYNMTLRSLAIKTTQDVTQMQRKDREAVIENKKRAAKYNMTSRALPLSTGVVVVSKKDQDNIGKALNIDVSPNIAKEVLQAVAKKRREEDTRAATASEPKQRNSNTNTPKQTQPQVAAATQQVEKKVEPVQAAATPEAEGGASASKQKIVMEGLGDALKSGDEEAINKVILKAFLETNAPHLVGKMDKLLNSYSSRMTELFDKLASDFPDANDAEISGQIKADKEISDAAADNDDLPLFSEEEEKKMEAASKVEPVGDVADDDSVQLYPDDMPDMSNDTGEKPTMGKKSEKPAILEELGDDDDDSLIIDADKAYEAGYSSVIANAEKDPEIQKRISADRRRSVLKNDLELARELRAYSAVEQQEPEKRESVVSENSLVAVDDPPETPALEGGYIVAAELEEVHEEKAEQPVSRWAVQLQNKNYALKQKLMKQGLSKQQVDALVENLDNNTSEML